MSQAVLILGSTDFLGNPIGFLHDISEGVSGLVSDGNVGGLLKNVAHGAANSAAKVTGSLSYGIRYYTTQDDNYLLSNKVLYRSVKIKSYLLNLLRRNSHTSIYFQTLNWSVVM